MSCRKNRKPNKRENGRTAVLWQETVMKTKKSRESKKGIVFDQNSSSIGEK